MAALKMEIKRKSSAGGMGCGVGRVGVVFFTPLKSKAACKLDRPEYDGI
jgi:hypothetical protein